MFELPSLEVSSSFREGAFNRSNAFIKPQWGFYTIEFFKADKLKSTDISSEPTYGINYVKYGEG